MKKVTVTITAFVTEKGFEDNIVDNLDIDNYKTDIYDIKHKANKGNDIVLFYGKSATIPADRIVNQLFDDYAEVESVEIAVDKVSCVGNTNE